MANNGRRWDDLAAAVINRRVALGMRRTKDLAERMGVSARLLGDVENGRRPSYSPTTLAALESALEWRAGSVAAVLAGGSPTPVGSALHSASNDELAQELSDRLKFSDLASLTPDELWQIVQRHTPREDER